MTKDRYEVEYKIMQNTLPKQLSLESICQLTREELVELVIRQQEIIEKQQKKIEQLEQELEKLKTSRNLDSKNSSKPPSTDILKKPEQKPEEPQRDEETEKRKPGGQPGHEGKTRKGFARIDRIEILRPQLCNCCGQKRFAETPIEEEIQQVAQLVERPIEIVEYHRQTCIFKKGGGRRQEAGGIPINKFRGFNQDAVFLALRVSQYMFFCFA